MDKKELNLSTSNENWIMEKNNWKSILILLFILLVLLSLWYFFNWFYSDGNDVPNSDEVMNNIEEKSVNNTGISNNDSENVSIPVENIDEVEVDDIDLYVEELYNYFSGSVSTSNIDVNQKNWLYKIWWSSITIDGISNYSLSPLDWEVTTNTVVDWWITVTWTTKDDILISSKEYTWISDLKAFRSYVYLDLVFSGGKITDWSLVDSKTKVNLWKLSKDELDEMYNFEVKYPIKEVDYKQWFKLSNLEENVVYKYVLSSKDTNIPWVINDLDYNVIVYEKKDYGHDNEYIPKVYFANDIGSSWSRSSSLDETVYMIYQKADIDDISFVLDPMYLGNYNRWEEIKIWNIDYLYNDTDMALGLIFIDESFWEKKEKERKLLKPWEFYKKSPFIDYLIIK